MSVDTPATVPRTREEIFIERLAALDRGDRARLRRNAGARLADARGVLGLFYRLLPPSVPEREHERYFMIATLYPLAGPSEDRNFGATLRRAKIASGRTSLDRRFTALLDSDMDQLPFRLRQLIRLADSHRVGVNWVQLLRDVLWWDHPERRVQKQWAMAYFQEELPEATRSDSTAPPGGEATPDDDHTV